MLRVASATSALRERGDEHENLRTRKRAPVKTATRRPRPECQLASNGAPDDVTSIQSSPVVSLPRANMFAVAAKVSAVVAPRAAPSAARRPARSPSARPSARPRARPPSPAPARTKI